MTNPQAIGMVIQGNARLTLFGQDYMDVIPAKMNLSGWYDH